MDQAIDPSRRVFDLHTHILPRMDDGCRDSDEAIATLRECAAQGVAGIVATPHYMPGRDISGFIEKRRRSFETLMGALPGDEVFPDIRLGAEVAYCENLRYEEDIEKLCFSGSRYILFELPFEKWSSHVLDDIEYISGTRGLMPIIAHAERYIGFQDKRNVDRLFSSGFIIQMNAEYVTCPYTARAARRIIKRKGVHLLCSDCHRPHSRPQNLRMAYNALERHFMHDYCSDLSGNSRQIFSELS